MGLTIEDEKAFKDLSMKKPAIVFGNAHILITGWTWTTTTEATRWQSTFSIKVIKTWPISASKIPEHFSVQRLKGFSDCAAKYGIDAKIKLCSNDEQHGYSSAKKILEERPGVKSDRLRERSFWQWGP